MQRLILAFVTATVLLVATSMLVRAEVPGPGQQRQVERARIALDAFLDDPDKGNMATYVQNAYGVLVIPEMLSGSFFFGADFGVGVLLVRDQQTGGWGDPVFYSLYGATFGLQFGGKSSDVVLTLMNEAVVDRFLNANADFKLGADMGLAVGRVGAAAGVATTANFGEDIYVFARSQGLFGGFALQSAVIVPNTAWNTAYYGTEVVPSEVARRQTMAANPPAAALQQSLTRF
jgi:lipid-binding SYLF domain-containing protein